MDWIHSYRKTCSWLVGPFPYTLNYTIKPINDKSGSNSCNRMPQRNSDKKAIIEIKQMEGSAANLT